MPRTAPFAPGGLAYQDKTGTGGAETGTQLVLTAPSLFCCHPGPVELTPGPLPRNAAWERKRGRS